MKDYNRKFIHVNPLPLKKKKKRIQVGRSLVICDVTNMVPIKVFGYRIWWLIVDFIIDITRVSYNKL